MIDAKDRFCVELGFEITKNTTIKSLIDQGLVEKEVLSVCDSHGEFLAVASYIFYGKVYYSKCPQCEKKREEEKIQAEKDREDKDREDKRLHYLNALKYRGCDAQYIKMIANGERPSTNTQFFNLRLAQSDLSVASLLSLNEKQNDFSITDDVVIFGGCGIGKSFFAYNLVNVGLKINKRYICKEMSEISSIYRNGMDNGGFRTTNSVENLKHFLEDIDCLIVDEVDTCLSTKDSRDLEAISHIIKICKFEGKRLIIIGNCNIKEFASALEPKIRSRLVSSLRISGWDLEDLRRTNEI